MQNDFMSAQWWRDQQARRDESRLERVANRVSVTVQAGHRVQHGGVIYEAGQILTLPKMLADNLVSGGHVVITP